MLKTSVHIPIGRLSLSYKPEPEILLFERLVIGFEATFLQTNWRQTETQPCISKGISNSTVPVVRNDQDYHNVER